MAVDAETAVADESAVSDALTGFTCILVDGLRGDDASTAVSSMLMHMLMLL